MVFVHLDHTAVALEHDLKTFSARKYIALTCTQGYGLTGEDRKEGLFDPIKNFLSDHPDWFVSYHSGEQCGMTVLSCVPEEKPAEPIRPWPPEEGPGTQLRLFLKAADIVSKPNCDCDKKANVMNTLGVEGCRHNIEQIVSWMVEGSKRWGWSDKITKAAEEGREIGWITKTGAALTRAGKMIVAANSVRKAAKAWGFKIDPINPWRSIIDEMIRRAEVIEQNTGGLDK